MTDDVVTAIREALSLPARRVNVRTPLRRLAKDSLDAIELLAALSEKYEVDIDVEELGRLETVGDLAAYIAMHRGEAKGLPPLERF